jgi:circadian clock protein KaiC
MKAPTSGTPPADTLAALSKAPSGIEGLDDITNGGLPRGRVTLVCGGPGAGKTLFAVEFLVRGAMLHGEPGVFISFEESADELAANVASLGMDLRRLQADHQLVVDYVRSEPGEIDENGEYDLEGLFVRLQLAIETVGAKRVVLDPIASLFSGLTRQEIVRSELHRLFRWLKDRGITVVITGEKGAHSLSRSGLEEYVADCVIAMDFRITDQISTRRLCVVKYRGSSHGTNEYPFIIGDRGISILPITTFRTTRPISTERLSTGIPRMDAMLGGKGYLAGTTVLVSGTAGTGKTSIAAYFARSACRLGKRCLFFAFEETADEITRNMRSIGLDLEPDLRSGTLRIVPGKPYAYGLELHLVAMHKAIAAFDPEVVILDPVTSFITIGTASDAKSMITRLIDFLKCRGATTLLTSLTARGTSAEELEQNQLGMSSLIDTWILLEIVRSGCERNRLLNIIKARGMAHSNQAAEYHFDDSGLHLVDTYRGTSEVLTGSARRKQEAEDLATSTMLVEGIARHEVLRQVRLAAYEAKVSAMKREFEADDAAIASVIAEDRLKKERLAQERIAMAKGRQAFAPAEAGDPQPDVEPQP